MTSAGNPDTRTPRVGVRRTSFRRLRVPDIAWIEIPGGPFVYQQSETRELETFWIAKYPITNAQFQTFIDDGGYADDRWWRDLEKPTLEAPRWPQGNRPRTSVNWYEAVAFTHWLTARLSLEEGAIRLPTEREWDKAARGAEGRVYPWGNEYRSGFSNVDERTEKSGPWGLGQTTAVGLYPQGRSLYGAEDLCGNVWEWCSNKYDYRDVSAIDRSGEGRTLRGGSYGVTPDVARLDFLYGSLPAIRIEYFGFRVVSSVPMVVG